MLVEPFLNRENFLLRDVAILECLLELLLRALHGLSDLSVAVLEVRLELRPLLDLVSVLFDLAQIAGDLVFARREALRHQFEVAAPADPGSAGCLAFLTNLIDLLLGAIESGLQLRVTDFAAVQPLSQEGGIVGNLADLPVDVLDLLLERPVLFLQTVLSRRSISQASLGDRESLSSLGDLGVEASDRTLLVSVLGGQGLDLLRHRGKLLFEGRQAFSDRGQLVLTLELSRPSAVTLDVENSGLSPESVATDEGDPRMRARQAPSIPSAFNQVGRR